MVNRTRDIVWIALLTAILFLQEEVLTFLPNIQLTIFLLVLYAKKLGLKKTTMIIFLHVLLDNLVMGSFNIIYIVFMFLGWFCIPLLLNTVFRSIEKPLPLACCGILFALLYSWIFIIPNVFIYQIHIWTYWMADIPFEILLAASSFLSILWLYPPCSKLFDHFLKAE